MQESGVRSQSRSQESEPGVREPGAGSPWESGVGAVESGVVRGVRSQESGVGSPGVTSQESGRRSRESGAQ